MNKEKLEELENIINEFKTAEKKELERDAKFLKFKSYEFKLNNGKTIIREELIKGNSNGSAVIIIPKLENGKYLTVIEPRVFTDLTVGIAFPAGYIDKGEEKEVSALRELREETGYVSDEIEYLDSYYQDEGCSAAMNYMFLAKNCKLKSEQDLDEDEFIKYMEFTLEELLELEEKGYIKGANTKFALQKLKYIM